MPFSSITSLGLSGLPVATYPILGGITPPPPTPTPTPPTTVKLFGFWSDPSGDGREGEIATAKAAENICSGSYIVEAGQGEEYTLTENGYFELFLTPGRYEFYIKCENVYNIRIPSGIEEIDIQELLC